MSRARLNAEQAAAERAQDGHDESQRFWLHEATRSRRDTNPRELLRAATTHDDEED